MKINFPKIKRSFKKKDLYPNPDICWEIILYLFFALLVVAAVFGFYMFRKVNQDSVISPQVKNTQLEKISKERMDKVLGYFTDRAKKSSNISKIPAPFIDPSL